MMKRLIIALNLLLVVVVYVQAQRTNPKQYSIAFYNLENLFDTIHDSGKNDYEYLPDGAKRWNSEKYKAKLANMSKVLSELSIERVPEGAAVIGVAEVENRRALDDLVSQPSLRKYDIVHYESPDRRGIDCALLYNPQLFQPTSSKLVTSTPFEGDTIHLTRGFLIVNGKMAGDDICFLVNHWPSRGAKSPVRVHAAKQVKVLTDSLLKTNKRLKIVVMGDFNDDPMDESLAVLGAKKYKKEVKKGMFFNPFWETLEDQGVGTLLYRGKWNLFDQIVISPSLLRKRRGLTYVDSEVFQRNYLIQQEGKYKGSLLRTHGGRLWLNGYSDHLPTLIYLKR